MIVGRVNSSRDPIIQRHLLDAQDHLHECSAVVDTGFNGWFSLPRNVIESLSLPWLRLGRASLADGSETLFDVYELNIVWDGERRTIPVDQSDSEPLVGMQLMDGYELRIQAVIDGSVMLERMK